MTQDKTVQTVGGLMTFAQQGQSIRVIKKKKEEEEGKGREEGTSQIDPGRRNPVLQALRLKR